MSYELHLLTTGAFWELPRQQQSLALDLARNAGARAASAANHERSSQPPDGQAYYRAVVQVAVAAEALGTEEERRWRNRCADCGASADPRIRVFLLAWAERARDLMGSGLRLPMEQRGAA